MVVETASLCGKRYKVTEGQFDGLCDTFKKELELMNMRPKGTKAHLETWVHEALHGCDWNKCEIMVEQTARDVARLLWRLGYRRIEE